MPELNATFKNSYGESRHWLIVDQARDPNAPPTLFDGYLEPNEVTASTVIYSADGVYGRIAYQRSDGPPTIVDSVTDGTEVSME